MSIPATMRALQQTSLNGPQDLRLITDAPVPVPGPGEVLIRVAAAEYTALPAVAVMPVPAGWAEKEALGLAVNWPTALAALRPLGRIAPGQTVLIHAAAGGTGQAAVKMANRSRMRRTWSRRRTCGPGGPTAGSRAGPRCVPGCTRSPPTGA